MPEKKSRKGKTQKPRVNVTDLELNPPDAESVEQKTGPKGGNFKQAWPKKYT